MTNGSSMLAIIFIGPPQALQILTSILNTRFSLCAGRPSVQHIPLRLLAVRSGSCPPSASASAVGFLTLPLLTGVTRSRYRLFGARLGYMEKLPTSFTDCSEAVQTDPYHFAVHPDTFQSSWLIEIVYRALFHQPPDLLLEFWSDLYASLIPPFQLSVVHIRALEKIGWFGQHSKACTVSACR